MPSIGHFILQQAAVRSNSTLASLNRGSPRLAERRAVPAALRAARPALARPPLFRLAGLAIGNGLTDPVIQVWVRWALACAGPAVCVGTRGTCAVVHVAAVQCAVVCAGAAAGGVGSAEEVKGWWCGAVRQPQRQPALSNPRVCC